GCKATRRPLEPEAIGAVMEVTKWLKPSISVSRIGDSASVQAATRPTAWATFTRPMETKTRTPPNARAGSYSGKRTCGETSWSPLFVANCSRYPSLPTGADQTRVHTEGQRQTQVAGHLDRAGSGLHDSSDAGAGGDLRSRPSTGNLRLPRWAQRPAGRRRGGGAAVPWPSGSRGRRPRGLLGSCFILPSGLCSDVKQRGMSRYRFDPQAFLLSSHDMDGIEFAALDTLQYGLA